MCNRCFAASLQCLFDLGYHNLLPGHSTSKPPSTPPMQGSDAGKVQVVVGVHFGTFNLHTQYTDKHHFPPRLICISVNEGCFNVAYKWCVPVPERKGLAQAFEKSPSRKWLTAGIQFLHNLLRALDQISREQDTTARVEVTTAVCTCRAQPCLQYFVSETCGALSRIER